MAQVVTNGGGCQENREKRLTYLLVVWLVSFAIGFRGNW